MEDLTKLKEELESCQMYVEHLTEQAKEYCTNKEFPLEERWAFFRNLNSVFKDECFDNCGPLLNKYTIFGEDIWAYGDNQSGDRINVGFWLTTQLDFYNSLIKQGPGKEQMLKAYSKERNYIANPNLLKEGMEYVMSQFSDTMLYYREDDPGDTDD
jgi:hypothetical protein